MPLQLGRGVGGEEGGNVGDEEGFTEGLQEGRLVVVELVNDREGDLMGSEVRGIVGRAVGLTDGYLEGGKLRVVRIADGAMLDPLEVGEILEGELDLRNDGKDDG